MDNLVKLRDDYRAAVYEKGKDALSAFLLPFLLKNPDLQIDFIIYDAEGGGLDFWPNMLDEGFLGEEGIFPYLEEKWPDVEYEYSLDRHKIVADGDSAEALEWQNCFDRLTDLKKEIQSAADDLIFNDILHDAFGETLKISARLNEDLTQVVYETEGYYER